MLIHKIYNNNVILSLDEKGKEFIAMGCGIAFKRKIGDNIPDELVEKVFILNDHDFGKQFQKMLSNLSIEYLQICSEIIRMAEKHLECKLNDRIYITLTDHIYMAVNRIKKGIPIRNMMLWEIKTYYPDEYNVAKETVKLLCEKFKVELPEDETGFIAMHFIDAQLSTDNHYTHNIVKIIHEIANIVRLSCRIEFDRKSMVFYRFSSHLKYLSVRIIEKSSPELSLDTGMLDIIRDKYPLCSQCVDNIYNYVENIFGYSLSYADQMYLMMHVTRLVAYYNANEKIKTLEDAL